jgi:hypothetical protein
MWQRLPELKAARDASFRVGRAEHNGARLAQFTCCALVRGRRCNRITIIETNYRHCLRHAGPAAAKVYRENCRKLFESGRYPATKWFRDEARRTRTALRDRQRRKRDGWVMPGLTLRFSDPIEARFRQDVASLLRVAWPDVPDLYRDQLRWSWRRFMLDRQRPDAWDAKSRSLLTELTARGPAGAEPLEHANGSEPHVLFVGRRATAFEWRSKLPSDVVERALRSPKAGGRRTKSKPAKSDPPSASVAL